MPTRAEKIREVEDRIDALLRQLEQDLDKHVEFVDFDRRRFTTRRISVYVEEEK
jgi:hypothetical protein